MNYIIVKEARELAGWKAEREALSVYEALEKLEDKRRAQGKRYSLALLLTCILLAKMAGETTLQAITEWVRLRGAWLQQVLPVRSRTSLLSAPKSALPTQMHAGGRLRLHQLDAETSGNGALTRTYPGTLGD
ncbi:MAG TPA: transposase family protein [Ktedonosporobacter sp.]|jgi:hypothetical protein|nr:transposase family protein [Ktedonosporobacter sp.]